MSEEAPRRTLGRKIFDGLAAATLVGFAAFCAIMMLCAARIPRLRFAGYDLKSVTYRDPAFSDDDSQLSFQRDFFYETAAGGARGRHQPPTASYTEEIVVPTGRCTPESARRDAARVREVVASLVRAVPFSLDAPLQLAVSGDHREIAFAAARGVVYRGAAGGYRMVSGEPLPPHLARLAQRPGRLDSAEPLEWADAAIGDILRDGVRPAIFADRLIRVHREAPREIDMLVELLVKIDTPEANDEVVRTVLSIRDVTLQRRLIDAAQNRARRFAVRPDGGRHPAPDPAARRSLLTSAVRRDWGEGATDFVTGWVLEALEDGVFAELEADARAGLVDRLARQLKPSYAARLAGIVEKRPPVESLAACELLRRLVGETEPAPKDAAAAEQWVRRLRARKPDLFKSP